MNKSVDRCVVTSFCFGDRQGWALFLGRTIPIGFFFSFARSGTDACSRLTSLLCAVATVLYLAVVALSALAPKHGCREQAEAESMGRSGCSIVTPSHGANDDSELRVQVLDAKNQDTLALQEWRKSLWKKRLQFEGTCSIVSPTHGSMVELTDIVVVKLQALCRVKARHCAMNAWRVEVSSMPYHSDSMIKIMIDRVCSSTPTCR